MHDSQLLPQAPAPGPERMNQSSSVKLGNFLSRLAHIRMTLLILSL